MAEFQTKAQAKADAPHPIRLEDYRPPDYLVDQVELRFALQPAATEVRTRLAIRRRKYRSCRSVQSIIGAMDRRRSIVGRCFSEASNIASARWFPRQPAVSHDI